MVKIKTKKLFYWPNFQWRFCPLKLMIFWQKIQKYPSWLYFLGYPPVFQASSYLRSCIAKKKSFSIIAEGDTVAPPPHRAARVKKDIPSHLLGWYRTILFYSLWYHTISISMTSLLTHIVAHSIRPSFRSKIKINNQPLKKLSKSWQKLQNADIPNQFSISKIIRIFLIFFIRISF